MLFCLVHNLFPSFKNKLAILVFSIQNIMLQKYFILQCCKNISKTCSFLTKGFLFCFLDLSMMHEKISKTFLIKIVYFLQNLLIILYLPTIKKEIVHSSNFLELQRKITVYFLDQNFHFLLALELKHQNSRERQKGKCSRLVFPHFNQPPTFLSIHQQ